MYYNMIYFPFSSVNDNDYTLVLCLNGAADFDEINKMLRDSKELFTQMPSATSGSDTVYNWEGTLTGSVKVTDDEREDTWEPLVCSKLSFNIAVNDFPTWLMPFCTNNRAKVILYRNIGLIKNEMWRGYLAAQTLNMTVVDNLLSCQMVACDEVAMAKYMNFKETLEYVTNDKWNTVFGLMQHFHTLHHTRGLSSVSTGFEKLYNIIGLSHSNRLFWHRNMRVFDDDGNAVNNLPDTLVVNLDRWLWLDDEGNSKTTWQDVLTEVCEYLGVTFAVGSYGLMTNCDAYMLTNPTDSALVQQFVEVFDSGTVTTHSTSMYATLNNPQKIGANLQLSAEPDKYSKVKVTSTPERWETHEYLTEENYKPIVEGNSVRYEWGVKNTSTGVGNFSSYAFHKFIYTKPNALENPYLNIPACADSEGYLMARDGILPYDDLDSCTGKTEPDSSCTQSLDFITFKEGCCCVKIGQGDIGGIDEDKLLAHYFLLMNHMWCTMYLKKDYDMVNEHLADTAWLKLMPLADNGAVHPSEKHFLKIEMKVMFIRENLPTVLDSAHGSSQTYLYLKAENNQPCQPVDWDTPAIILPQDSTLADLTNTNILVDPSLDLWYDLYFKAYIRIGSYYYNGTTWEYVSGGATPPKCDVTLWSDTNEIKWVTDNGLYVIGTKNYYWSFSNPYRGSNVVDRYSNSTKLLSSLESLSIHGQPLHGDLEMQILGQVRFQSTTDGDGNSIPFILINDIDINYTDEAELVGKKIDNKVEITMDAVSHTKETYEKNLMMASPSVDGFFNNVLVYDGGKSWHNLAHVRPQTTADIVTPEMLVALHLADQYSTSQLYVELETPVQYDTNVHNVCFRVQGLVETDGVFLPVKRTFDYTKETMRAKLMRINTAPSD